MNDSPTKRLPRLTAILTLLQTKRLVTASEISKKYDISIRTVYRDIRSLEQSGVPVVTEEGKGYTLMEGYNLPPVMFTEKEAFALVTAEQIVMRSKDSSLISEFSAAIAKIKTVLRYSNKDKIELLSERVFVGKNVKSQITSQNLTEIQFALTNFRLLRVAYETPEGIRSDRLIEPFCLYNSFQEDWTLVAFCRLRKDFRSFRLDRIKKVELRPDVFKRHKLTMAQYVERYVKSDYTP